MGFDLVGFVWVAVGGGVMRWSCFATKKETLLIWRSGASAQRYYLLGGLFAIIAPSCLGCVPKFMSRLLLFHDHC